MPKKLLFAVAAVILLAVLSFLFLNSSYGKRVIAGYLIRYAKDQYGLTVQIESLDYGLSPLTIRLKGLRIEGSDRQTFFSARSITTTIPYSSFRSDQFLVHEVILDSPFCNLDHIPRFKSTGGGEGSFRLERATIESGELIVSARKIEEIKVTAIVDPAKTEIQELTAKFRTAEISGHGTLFEFKRYQFQYDVKGDAAEVSELFQQVPKMTGGIVAKGKLEGIGGEFVVTGDAGAPSLIVEGSSPFSVNAEYKWVPEKEQTPYSVKLNWKSLPWTLFQKFYPQIPSFGSISNGSLEYTGGTDLLTGSGKIQVTLEKDDSDRVPLSGSIRGRLAKGSMELEPSNLTIRSSRAEFSGTLLSSEMRLNVRASSPSLSELAFLSPSLSRIPGSFQFTGTLSGPYRTIQAKGKMQGTSNDLHLDASGSFTAGTGILDVTFAGTAGDSALKRLVSPDIEGTLEFSGRASGALKKPKLQADILGSALKVKEIDLGNANANLESDGNFLIATAQLPGISTTADCTYRFVTGNYQIQAHFEDASIEPLRALLPDAFKAYSGNLTADLNASGNVDHWKNSDATLVVDKAFLKSEQLEVKILPESRFQMEKGIVTVDTRAEMPQGTMRVQGTASMRGDSQLDLHATGETNAGLVSLWNPAITASGSVSVDAFVKGTFSKPDLSGAVRTENLELLDPVHGLSLKQSNILAEFSGTKVLVKGSGLLNDAEISLDGTIPFSRDKGEIHLDLRSFPLVSVLPDSKVTGTVDVIADFEGLGFPYQDLSHGISRNSPIWNWTGSLAISPANLKLGEREITASSPFTVRLQKGVLEVDAWQVTSGELLDLALRGNMRFDTGAIDAALRLSVNVNLLSSLRADIQSDGPLSVDLKVGGTLAKPEYSGSVAIRGASLRIPNVQLALEDVNLYAPFDPDRLRIETLTARAGGGTISGGGEIQLRASEATPSIWLKGSRVALSYPVGLRSQNDFDLKLAFVKKELVISGDVRVLRSSYSENFGFKNRLLRTLLDKRAELFEQRYLKSVVNLAVKVRTIDDFRLKNNVGLARASADLQIIGTVYQPRLSGRATVQGGSRLYFRGRRYDVESATVDFYGTRQQVPDLNLTMTTLVQDYTNNNFYEITLPIAGPLNNLEFRNPRSIPSLPDDQIFSLLLSGSTSGSEQSASSPAVLFQAELIAFLSGQLLFGVEEQFAHTFGLSRIDVQQNLLATGDNAGAKLIVGKDIGTAFSITYSFPLNDTNKQTWITSYRYRRDFLFRAIRQEDNTYTLSARHTVLFGRGVSYKYLTSSDEKRATEFRIASIEIINDSNLSDEEVRKKIKLSEGDLYDYWQLQDNLENLEKIFQDKGYLFPSVRIQETDLEGNTVSLSVQISDGNPSSMSFTGAKIKRKQMDQYKLWWREGISENLVTGLIRQDLLKNLWLDGYHDASVTQTTVNQNGTTDYHFEIAPGVQYKFAEIQYAGNQHLTAEQLDSDVILFYESRAEMIAEAIHDFDQFRKKVEAAYVQKGLLQTRLVPGPTSTDKAAGKIVRQVGIEEGPFSYVADVIVSNGQQFPPELENKLKIQKGDVVDFTQVPNDEATIREFYESEGYLEISLNSKMVRQKETSNLVLTHELTLGIVTRVASVVINGNQVTRKGLIENRVGIWPGDILSSRKIVEAQKRLYDLSIFQVVKISTEPTDGRPGEVDLIVDLVESKEYEFQYGPRYNSEGGIGAEVNLVDHNLFGIAHRGSFYGRYDGNQPLYRLDYFIPNHSGFWGNTLFSLFYKVEDEDIDKTFMGERLRFTFETKTSAFQLQQDRRFGRILRFLYGFQAGTTQILIPDVPGLETSTGSFISFGASIYLDTRDDILNAKRGQFLSLAGEFAPAILGTDIKFNRTYDQYFYFKKLGPVVWASGVRVGFIKSYTDQFTLDERFQTGGGTTVRGFGTDDLTPQDDIIGAVFGGDALFILNQEIRFPIHKWLTGAVFYDGGNVFRFLRDFDPLDLRNTGGFGIRLETSYIVLRFDVGFNFDPMNDEAGTVFHFGIGQAF
jgi:outer membrane protein assembly complex protein YaeT